MNPDIFDFWLMVIGVGVLVSWFWPKSDSTVPDDFDPDPPEPPPEPPTPEPDLEPPTPAFSSGDLSPSINFRKFARFLPFRDLPDHDKALPFSPHSINFTLRGHLWNFKSV